MACHSLKPATKITQGLTGYVYKETGNQMPSPNKPPRKPKGIKCDLYIYQPTSQKQANGGPTSFTSINSKLITVVHTDSLGHYAVNLSPGKYSVFIRTDEGSFFADESDDKGSLNPAEVTADKVTERNFTLRAGAVY
jgi:hypothetical protein